MNKNPYTDQSDHKICGGYSLMDVIYLFSDTVTVHFYLIKMFISQDTFMYNHNNLVGSSK